MKQHGLRFYEICIIILLLLFVAFKWCALHFFVSFIIESVLVLSFCTPFARVAPLSLFVVHLLFVLYSFCNLSSQRIEACRSRYITRVFLIFGVLGGE